MSNDVVSDLRKQEERKRMKKRCSFCAKSAREVKALVEGPDRIRICNECVGLCVDILTKAGAL